MGGRARGRVPVPVGPRLWWGVVFGADIVVLPPAPSGRGGGFLSPLTGRVCPVKCTVTLGGGPAPVGQVARVGNIGSSRDDGQVVGKTIVVVGVTGNMAVDVAVSSY